MGAHHLILKYRTTTQTRLISSPKQQRRHLRHNGIRRFPFHYLADRRYRSRRHHRRYARAGASWYGLGANENITGP